MHELVLYLMPEDELRRQCDEFFRQSQAQFGATMAHTYPPHVTLTGFFHRSTERLSVVMSEFAAVLPEADITPTGAVTVVGVETNENWVGLEIASPWANELTARVVDGHEVFDGEDRLRPKDWLHLSLAYGLDDDQNLDDFAELAREIVDPQAPVTWHAGLWERLEDGQWTRAGGSWF